MFSRCLNPASFHLKRLSYLYGQEFKKDLRQLYNTTSFWLDISHIINQYCSQIFRDWLAQAIYADCTCTLPNNISNRNSKSDRYVLCFVKCYFQISICFQLLESARPGKIEISREKNRERVTILKGSERFPKNSWFQTSQTTFDLYFGEFQLLNLLQD